MRRVFVAMPCHSNNVTVGTFMSVLQTANDLHDIGVDLIVQTWVGDSLIAHARNALVGKFMTTECDDLVWIDSDIAWDTAGFLRLLHWDVDIVAGCYRFKSDDENYPFNILANTKEFWTIDPATGNVAEPGVFKVGGVGMGFTRMKRSVIEKMMASREHQKYMHKSAPDFECHCLFDVEYRDGHYYGEDYVFCGRWRELGGDIWVDPEIKLTHIGTKDYAGHLGSWLRNKDKQPEMIDAAKVREVFSHPDYGAMMADIMPVESAA